MSEISVRKALPFDWGPIAAMLETDREECPNPMPPIDLWGCMETFAKTGRKGTILVATAPIDGKQERIVGVLALEIRFWPWNAAIPFLESQHFYVHPKYRASNAAEKLIEAAEIMADLGNVLLSIQTMHGGPDVDRKDKFMERKGFAYVGGNFFYYPKAKAPAEEQKAA